MPDAARQGDHHACDNQEPKAHTGGPIQPDCSPDVDTNQLPQARATDRLECSGVPVVNFIVTGSATVEINGKLAARKTDKTMHPQGEIDAGSPNVEIGGPAAGATLGHPDEGQAACQAAAAGRASGRTQQSYTNCGVESSRQIINQVTGAGVDEDTLLNNAIANGDAGDDKDPRKRGLARPTQLQDILARGSSVDGAEGTGVATHLADNSVAAISQAVAEGKGVISFHDVAELWGPGNEGLHFVLVTGLEYDANGNLVNVVINDTGTGECGKRVPVDQYERSLDLPWYSDVIGNTRSVVTDDPIW